MKGKVETRQQLLHEMEGLRARLEATEHPLPKANERLPAQIAGDGRSEETFEQVQKFTESIVETIHEPLLVLTPDLRVITPNH
jgi:hypothetical protein